MLLASSSYPFHRGDFHAFFVHDMARAIAARGAKVVVVTPATPEGGAGRERWDDVDVVRFPYRGLHALRLTGAEGMVENVRASPWRALAAPALMAAYVAALRREAASFCPDVVVSHWLVPSGLAAAVARLDAELLHIAHSSDVHLLARLPAGRAIAGAVAASGPVLATSGALARRIVEARLVERPLPWHLGVDVDVDVEPADERSRAPGSPLRVGAMSRLIAGKGLRTLVRALASAPGMELHIAGGGPLLAELRTLVRALDVDERVVFRGPVIGEEKRAFLSSLDLFACVPMPRPGRFEDNLPVSVLEAMARGVPVLGTRVGAMPELLAGGGGIVTADSVDDVAATLRTLTVAALGERAAQARRTALGFTWDRSLTLLDEARRG